MSLGEMFLFVKARGSTPYKKRQDPSQTSVWRRGARQCRVRGAEVPPDPLEESLPVEEG
ncbi:hypothetical protein GCM10010520_29640 [Rhizobium viscosum]